MTNEPPRPEGEAAPALVERLEALLADYVCRSAQEQPRGFVHLFRRWVSYNEQRVDLLHREFLEAVTDTVARLAEALAQAEPPEEARALAARAVGLLLDCGPGEPRSDGEWYLLVAGYQSGVLFPFLSREELLRQRDAMLARTPRRLMYPRQLELLEQAETLLKRNQ